MGEGPKMCFVFIWTAEPPPYHIGEATIGPVLERFHFGTMRFNLLYARAQSAYRVGGISRYIPS